MKTAMVTRMIRLGLITFSYDKAKGEATFQVTAKGLLYDDDDSREDGDESVREVSHDHVERRFERILKKATSQ